MPIPQKATVAEEGEPYILPLAHLAPLDLGHFQAVNIGIGTFAVVTANTTGADGKAMVVRKPIFKPCRFMKTFYKLKCAESRIPSKKIFALLSLCSPCLSLHAVVPVPRQSKVSCTMERLTVGAHTASRTCPCPGSQPRLCSSSHPLAGCS